MAKRRKSGDGRSGDSDPTARGAVSSDGLGGSYADLKLAVARASASEGQRLAWVAAPEIPDWPLPAADAPVVAKLIASLQAKA